MESTAHQLPMYPHRVTTPGIPETIYQVPSHYRCQSEIRGIPNHDLQLHQSSESFANLDYQDIIARYNDTAGMHTCAVFKSATSNDDINDRKDELRYDARFGGNFDRRNTRIKSLRSRQDRDGTFMVASARTLCSLSPESSPPASPSSHSPSLIYKETLKIEHGIGPQSIPTPMLVEKHHNIYCRIKTFLVQFLRLYPDTTMIRICSHKFRHGRCKKCDLPEAILPYLNGGMRAGFYCKQDGCEGCSNRASTSICDACGSEEDLCVPPLRIRSSMVASSLHTDNRDTDTGSRLTIAEEAAQIGFIDSIPTEQRVHILTSINSMSESSISSTDLSSDSFFESNPVGPFSSPVYYSLGVPPYLPTHDRNTLTACPRPTVAVENEDSTPSPGSVESSEVFEFDVLAIAVPILQVSPTTIQIRQSGTASQPSGITRKIQSLQDIVHDAVHGDMESQVMILRMYQDISTADAMSALYHKSEPDSRLIRKARLVLDLQVQEAAGHIPVELVEKVSVQLLSQHRNHAMRMEAFAAYICQAVVEKELSEARGTQILALAEDEM